jgi:tetratricopeptide (TPR) repeat protein
MRKYKIILSGLIGLSLINFSFAQETKEKPTEKNQKVETKKKKDCDEKRKKPKPKKTKKDLEKERRRLFLQILGLYQDKIYSLAYRKAKEYLLKYPNDKKNKKELIKIMLNSAIALRNDKYILEIIDFINRFPDLPEVFKEKVYGTIIKYYAKNPKKLKLALEKILKYVKNPKLRQQFTDALIDIYYKYGEYDKLAKMKNIPPKYTYLKVISLYKLGRYEDVIRETEDLLKFPVDVKDKVLYYRALSFYKLGEVDKAVELFEMMKEKNPELLKIIISHYLKKEDFKTAKKYLYELSKYPEYYDLAYYLLGYLEDREGNFDKAFQYYSVAAKYSSKYAEFAKKRIREFLKSGILDVYYSVRIGTFKEKKYADELVKRFKHAYCFTRKYKDMYAVYCGKFKYFPTAQERLELWLARGFDDAIIEKLADYKGVKK